MLINKTFILKSVDNFSQNKTTITAEIFLKENILSVKCFLPSIIEGGYIAIFIFNKVYVFPLYNKVYFSEKITVENADKTAGDLILITVFKVDENSEKILPLYQLEKGENLNEYFYKKIKEEIKKINSEIIYDDYKIAEEDYYQIEKEKTKNDSEDFCYENAYFKEQIIKEEKEESASEKTKNYDYETVNEYEKNKLASRLEKLKNGAFSHNRLVVNPTKLIKNAVFYTAFDEIVGEYFIGEKIDSKSDKYLVFLFKSALIKNEESLDKIACFYPNSYFDDKNGFYAIFQSEKSGEIIEF